ncbi:MAG: SDR family NAD(P)-dependent oxidoreductase [Alphaproteobacteria bacterium]|nr:SDR family NAD(P)-dependent oxidoreductase [Alphaproteobacteria bacterium]
MEIRGSRVLVTGANRGLGRAFVDVLVARGAATVYATGRDLHALEEVFGGCAGVTTSEMDVTSDASVSAAAEACGEADIVINNAGLVLHAPLLASSGMADARAEMETNFWGPLRVCRAFAPRMRQRGAGALVNILSMGALASMPFVGSYCASKAAALSMTQGVRGELAGTGILVVGVIAGPILTDMAREHEREGRHPPEVLAHATLDAIEAGRTTVYPDPTSAGIGDQFARDPAAVEAAFAKLR